MVAGGWNERYLASAELYDPATEMDGHGRDDDPPLLSHGHLLPNGKVLVARRIRP